MYLGTGAVAGTGKHWTIDGDNNKSYIAYGGTSWSEASNDNGTTAKIYLGTDGISLGTRFSVSPQGQLKAYSGQIGGWDISKTQLKSSSNNFYINDEDIKYSIQPNAWCKVINNTISTEDYHIFRAENNNINQFAIIVPTDYKIYLPIYDENGNLCVEDNTLKTINTLGTG